MRYGQYVIDTRSELHEVVIAIFLPRAFFESFLRKEILIPLGFFLVGPFLLLLGQQLRLFGNDQSMRRLIGPGSIETQRSAAYTLDGFQFLQTPCFS